MKLQKKNVTLNDELWHKANCRFYNDSESLEPKSLKMKQHACLEFDSFNLDNTEIG